MASSTHRALADRAIRAAGLIERWNKLIKEEMKNQNIDYDDDEKVLMLPVRLVIAQLSFMNPLAREIREFQGHLTSRKVRGRRWPRN